MGAQESTDVMESTTTTTYGPFPYLLTRYDRTLAEYHPIADLPDMDTAVRTLNGRFMPDLLATIETHRNDRNGTIDRYARVRVPEYHVQDFTRVARSYYPDSRYPTVTRHVAPVYGTTWTDNPLCIHPDVSRAIDKLRYYAPDSRHIDDARHQQTADDVRQFALTLSERLLNSGRIDDPTHPDYLPNRVGNYLMFDYDKKHLSYVPHRMTTDDTRDYFAQSPIPRVTGKPARILRTLFGIDATDAVYEIVGNALSAAMQDHGTFRLVTGEDIRHYYDANNAHPDLPHRSGVLSSCMRYSYCADYLDLYVDNPDTCALLVLVADDTDPVAPGSTLGRALIWTTDDGNRFMDRSYTSDDRMADRFRTYARETLGCIESYTTSQSVNVRHYNTKSGRYPYMDTLCYLTPDDGDDNTTGPGTLTANESYGDLYRILTSTGGDYETRGITRQYRVTLTRTITQTVVVYVDAASEDDAAEIADEYIDDHDITDDSRYTSWDVDETELYD